jgi:hypothetical protein
MPPLYKQKSKNRSQPATQCKDCGSYNTERMHRTFFEKFLCSLTSGKYAYEKYFCKACNTSTFKSLEEAEARKSALKNKASAL